MDATIKLITALLIVHSPIGGRRSGIFIMADEWADDEERSKRVNQVLCLVWRQLNFIIESRLDRAFSSERLLPE